MTVRSLTLILLLAASPVAAQKSKHDRAKAFTIDGVAAPDATFTPAPSPDAAPAANPDATTTAAPVLPAPIVPDSAVTAGTPAADASAAAPAPAGKGFRASFTLDTPIGDLIADPAAKAVLDKDLPGLSSDDNLDKFAKLGLRQFQPLTGGQLTDALLVKVARDLSTLSGPMLAPVPPTSGGKSKRNHDESR